MPPRERPGRSIKGPQSALTDFLASHNISANQIRLDAEQRRRQAEQSQQDTPNGESSTLAVATPAQPRRTRASAAADDQDEVPKKKRKLSEQKAIDKIKAKKKQKKGKNPDLDDSDDDDLFNAFRERAAPLPGQMANCEICDKRFTVTPYNRSGPNGGLLCTPCGKELDKEAPPKKKTPKKPTGGAIGRRRTMQSSILDGTYQLGAKSLVTLCVEILAKNIALADELGDLPARVVDKIARKLSKHRLVNHNTVDLFLTPVAEDVMIYDGAKLGSADFIRVFQTVPKLKNLKIRNAIQFKDEVMDFLLSRNIELESFYLHGANLLSDSKWQEFLKKKGKSLRSLQVYYTDKHFGDETLALLHKTCPSLERLKVKHNQRVTSTGIKALANIQSLKHLGLELNNPVHPDIYVRVLNAIGRNLRTFSISRNESLDNTVLDAIHHNCRHLEKLRITDSEAMTDDGFVRLFKAWENKPLVFLDLQKNRHLDSSKPNENEDNVGLCSDGFRAMMKHSGRDLQNLNLHACRDISEEAFEDVFSKDKVYPELEKFEVSFCHKVTDFIVGSIFRSCPQLRELNVFGCMKVKDVAVPRGRILVGVPNALGMVIEGDAEDEDSGVVVSQL